MHAFCVRCRSVDVLFYIRGKNERITHFLLQNNFQVLCKVELATQFSPVFGRNKKITKLESAISPYVIQSVFLIRFLMVAAVMFAYHIGSLGLLGI